MSLLERKTFDNLFQVRRTILEMLRDRGYVVVESEIEMTKEQFITRFGDNLRRGDLDFSRTKPDDPTDKMCVFFVEEEKPGTEVIWSYAKRMASVKVSKAILVVQRLATTFVRNFVEKSVPKFHMEFFLETELLVNITKHFLVPKHEMLSSDQIKTLLDRYNVRTAPLPKIQVGDPVARYYGLRQGQVVKITRPSETAGRYMTYRIAV